MSETTECVVLAPDLTIKLPERANGIEVDVFVYPTLADMRKAWAGDWHLTDDEIDRCDGMCIGVSVATRPDVVAVVFLTVEQFCAGYVAHEMGHAAMRVMDRLVGSVVLSNGGMAGRTLTENHHTAEETFCIVLETLCREFWIAYADTRPADTAAS